MARTEIKKEKNDVSKVTLSLVEGSSQIVAIGYNQKTKTLAIVFKGDILYHYYNVPPVIYDQLVSSESSGSYFHQNIRKANYEYKKIGKIEELIKYLKEVKYSFSGKIKLLDKNETIPVIEIVGKTKEELKLKINTIIEELA